MNVPLVDLFAALVENSHNFVGIAGLDGTLTYVNAAGRRMLGAEPPEVFAARTVAELFDADDLAYAREVILASLGRDHRWSGDFRLRGAGGPVPISVFLTIYHLMGEGNEPTAIAISAQDIRARRRSEQRLRTLVDAGAAMTQSLDLAATLAEIADLLVRTMATACVVDIFRDGPNGTRTIQRVAASHIDRASRARLSAGIADGQLVPERPAHPVARVLKDGSSSLVPAIDDAWIRRVALSPRHAELIRALGLHAWITVPLVATGDVVGALTCVLGTESSPRASIPFAYDAEDLFFVEELGRRAGAAMENARVYQQQSRIAATLQAASLPRRLPAIPALAIDAEYRPGKAEATIGGDWYDAFELDDGRVVFTIGDVLGSGLQAAVTMTKLRQAMQSAAMVAADPAVMLEVADKTLRLHDPDGYATALSAIYDPRTKTTVLASAGHPGPAVRARDGTITDHVCRGLLLGLQTGAPREQLELATPPGTTLVFFTDGLTEATRNLDEGHARLRAALADDGVLRAPRPANAIVEHVLAGEEAHDDIAVLTATIGERRGQAR